jgi:hypothetical protein
MANILQTKNVKTTHENYVTCHTLLTENQAKMQNKKNPKNKQIITRKHNLLMYRQIQIANRGL